MLSPGPLVPMPPPNRDIAAPLPLSLIHIYLLEACAFANVVSNLAVTRMGTAPSMPTRREIDAFLEAHPSAAD